jgi:hypothetical protein
MDTADWFQAAHPSPAVCLGLTLRPYSLGHEILLNREHSAFVLTGASASGTSLFGELALACLICSQPYAQACRFLASRWQPAIFRRLWKIRFALHAPDLARELKGFRDYRDAAAWFPEENRPMTGRTLASPWPFRMMSFLITEAGFQEEQALDYPLSKATVLYSAWAEYHGKIQLTNDQDEALFAARDSMDPAAFEVTPEEEAAARAELEAMRGDE